MANLFDSLFRLSAEVAESGLLLMDSTLRTMQSAVATLTGSTPPPYPTVAPLNGPPNTDEAVSDLSTRLTRMAMTTPLKPASLVDAWREVLDSAVKSFGGLDLSDPRALLVLPFQLPLSLATLMTQQSLRGLYTSYVVGPSRFVKFATYMGSSFADVHVFISLQYKEQEERYRRHLEENPDDSRIRFKLGLTYIKMGLYPKAVEELAIAAEDPEMRAAALHESAVANYRGGNLEQSVMDGVSALEADPSNPSSRWWLFLAAHKLGGYPAHVPEDFRMEIKAGRHASKVQFEDVAHKIGLDKTAAGRGTAVFDMDGDGYLDIVISSGHGGCSVFRNNGDGTFRDVTPGSGLDDAVNTFAIAVGDYNNDGFDDLYITRLGFYEGESLLYRNNGDGTFTDVTKEAGVACWAPSFTAQWVDYDCDGNLDLFVANNLSGLFDRKVPNLLFHNNGDGTFTEVSEQAGLRTIYPTLGATWGDYDNDGYPDLFLSCGVGRAQLFHNNGDGTFTDVSRRAGIDEIRFGSNAYWCDYDDDGWLDLVQNVWSPEEDVLHTLRNGKGPEGGSPMRIYHNNRDGTFTVRNRELGIDGCFGTMSGNAGDFNNDGYTDILLGNGDPHMDRTEPPIILENDGTGHFNNVTFAAGLPFAGKGHGANMADLGGDGRLCLIIASGGAYPADLLTTSIFRPKTLPGNYLNVRLVGTKSNRNAVDARLKLEAGGRSQHRLVSGGSGFGYLPYEQHFGLGGLEQVDSLEIRWPSGLKQRLENLPFNATILIIEGRDGWEEVYPRKTQEAVAVAPLVTVEA
jgi:tetratricopeptide (TPR) repeat protein